MPDFWGKNFGKRNVDDPKNIAGEIDEKLGLGLEQGVDMEHLRGLFKSTLLTRVLLTAREIKDNPLKKSASKLLSNTLKIPGITDLLKLHLKFILIEFIHRLSKTPVPEIVVQDYSEEKIYLEFLLQEPCDKQALAALEPAYALLSDDALLEIRNSILSQLDDEKLRLFFKLLQPVTAAVPDRLQSSKLLLESKLSDLVDRIFKLEIDQTGLKVLKEHPGALIYLEFLLNNDPRYLHKLVNISPLFGSLSKTDLLDIKTMIRNRLSETQLNTLEEHLRFQRDIQKPKP